MSNRIKTAPSLLIVALLAGVVSTSATCIAARAANDCLSGPKHEAPPGRHWYYRIDRPNNRKCWFVGEEGQHVSQTGSRQPLASPSPSALPPQTEPAIQPLLADARAELPMVTTPAEPPQWLGPTKISNPEKVAEVVQDVSPSETPSPSSARDPEGETGVMRNDVIDGQMRAESGNELLRGATDREPTAESFEEDTTAGLLRTGLALLLIVLGLSTIAGCLVFRLFRRSTGRSTRRPLPDQPTSASGPYRRKAAFVPMSAVGRGPSLAERG
jgi:hypothetical protein